MRGGALVAVGATGLDSSAYNGSIEGDRAANYGLVITSRFFHKGLSVLRSRHRNISFIFKVKSESEALRTWGLQPFNRATWVGRAGAAGWFVERRFLESGANAPVAGTT